jgi:hypothetical protein
MSLVEDLKNKTVAQLKTYAKTNNIDLFGTSTKDEILETILNFVPIEEFPEPKTPRKEIKKDSGEKVAIYSLKNLYANGFGDISTGYNIVSKEASEKWVSHKAVRIATPEEVAAHYGKL